MIIAVQLACSMHFAQVEEVLCVMVLVMHALPRQCGVKMCLMHVQAARGWIKELETELARYRDRAAGLGDSCGACWALVDEAQVERALRMSSNSGALLRHKCRCQLLHEWSSGLAVSVRRRRRPVRRKRRPVQRRRIAVQRRRIAVQRGRRPVQRKQRPVQRMRKPVQRRRRASDVNTVLQR